MSDKNNNQNNKNFLFWIVSLLTIILVYNLFQMNSGGNVMQNFPFSEFLKSAENGTITDAKLNVPGYEIEGHFSDGQKFTTHAPNYPGLIDKLRAGGVQITTAPAQSKFSNIISALVSWLPMIIIIGIWIMFMRQMQGGSGKAMGFGKSKARLLTEKSTKIMFKDVAGIDEAKNDLSEVVDFLRDPRKFQVLGGKIPKGCLLIGPPGTGKTLLARAIAGEANVPFFTISGSDFVEMFVGVGASRVRDMFEQGKKNAPCIIFIDEIDAVGRHRGVGMGGGNDEREQTLNQLLVEMDGFEANEGVILIAATNRPDVLDPALLRPGRFDRQIEVPTPDIKGREQILKVHLEKIKKGPDVEPRIIARGTPGFSGADLSNLVNEAALFAARNNKKVVTMSDLEFAKDKVMMGSERKSMVMSEQEKKLTAYHESGHALVAIHSPASDPIHKATIIPRGRALGLVMRLPESDRFSETREQLETNIVVAMGGRVAEELIFGHDKVTSGASSDIKQATRIARAMVSEWGMSDVVGPLFHGGSSGDPYAAKQNQNNSDETNHIIDQESKKLVEKSYEKAKKILTDNIKELHLLATALLEYETLSGEEIQKILKGEKIRENFAEIVDEEVISSFGSSLPNSEKN